MSQSASPDNTLGLLNELRERLERQLHEFQDVLVRIAVTGQSGAGKSTLINALLGKRLARADYVEGTKEAKEYEHREGNLTLVDLPGIGTPSFSRSDYVTRLKLDSFECFLLVTADRFLDDEQYLYRYLRNDLQRACFLARTKFDQALENARYDDEAVANLEITELEQLVRKRITEYIRKDLNLGEDAAIYLVSGRHPERYDLPKLWDAIKNSLHGVKRDRFIADAAAFSEAAFQEKRRVAEKRVGVYAGLAALNGLNPVPGLDVALDLTILLRLSGEVRSIYGLTDEQLSYRQGVWNTPTVRAAIQRTSSYIAKYATKEGVLLLLKRLASRATVKEVAKWVPFVGQLVSASLAFKLTYSFGENLVEDCDKAAREIFTAMLGGGRT
jgi:predicted GTPase